MKFMQKDAGLFTAEDGRAVCRVKEPFVELDGRDVSAAEAGLTVSRSVSDCGDGLFLFENTVKNTSPEEKTFKLIFELVTCYAPTHWVIPCVSYNGNEWGEGKEPKGMLAENGEPWIHPYDRTPIPSCSVTETEAVAVALFASGDSPESMKSSVSVRPAENGTVSQRIYWPVTEAPFTYCDNDKYTDRCDDYLTLAPGESFTARCYLLLSEPKWKNYGITDSQIDSVLNQIDEQDQETITNIVSDHVSVSSIQEVQKYVASGDLQGLAEYAESELSDTEKQELTDLAVKYKNQIVLP